MFIPPFRLERFFDQFEFSIPFLLCASDCETLSIEELFDQDQNKIKEFLQLRLGYTDTKGGTQLREKISTLYEHQEISSILACSGAEEAIYIFMNSTFKTNDHLIIQHPCYQALFEIPLSIGCNVSFWPAMQKNSWHFDLNYLKTLINPKTRAIVINSPHNPTGHHFTLSELYCIIELARKHNLILFSDEVYRFLEYKQNDQLPGVADLYENGISLGVMSKSFGLAGLRIGWLTSSNKKIINIVSILKDYTTICAAAPSETIAVAALTKKESILTRNRNLVISNLNILNQFMRSNSGLFNWIPPKAGCLAFPCLHNDVKSDVFYEELRNRYGVLLLPGSVYNMNNHYFRIGFGRFDFQNGLERIQKYVDSIYN